jgi:hypothetical protein
VYRRALIRRAAAASAAVAAGCTSPVGTDSKEGVGRDAGPESPSPPAIDQQTPTSGVVPSLPVAEVKAIVASGIESAPESVADLAAFETALGERDVEDAALSEHQSHLSLSHAVDRPDGSGGGGGVAGALGVVAGTYAAYVDAGDWRPLSVEVTRSGPSIGTYAVAPEWVSEYTSGRTTAKAYGEKVLGTVKMSTS